MRPPEAWSVFNRAVCTYNDTEGWHRRLNTRGRSNQHMYNLVSLLHKEAALVPIQAQLVKDKKLKRIQKKAFQTLQGRLFKLWQRYINKEIKTSELLAACNHLSQPNLDV